MNLAKLKPEEDKINVGKLTTVPTDFSRLSNVVVYHVVKKTIYDKLVTKVNSTETSKRVWKTLYDTDKLSLDNEINDADKKLPDISELANNSSNQKQITIQRSLK